MLNNINKIEQLFSENLASPSYIVLATYYYQQRLFDYAQKVCEIGLKHDSGNIDGNYMMAKLLLVKNKTSQAEQLLKKILYKEPYHLNSILLLIQIKQSKGQKKQQILKELTQSILFYYDHPVLKTYLAKTKLRANKEVLKNKKIKVTQSNFKINTKLATKTLYQLLVSQKKYKEAQSILLIMKSIKKNNNFVNLELKKIKKYIN